MVCRIGCRSPNVGEISWSVCPLRATCGGRVVLVKGVYLEESHKIQDRWNLAVRSETEDWRGIICCGKGFHKLVTLLEMSILSLRQRYLLLWLTGDVDVNMDGVTKGPSKFTPEVSASFPFYFCRRNLTSKDLLSTGLSTLPTPQTECGESARNLR